MSQNAIPLVNLQRQYQRLKADIDQGIREVCERGDFILGRAVESFEQSFAQYLDVRHCIGVASGTDALHLALRALGVGAGDEVIVPANTFIATAQAVSCCGAVPVLVDCDESTATIDVERAAEATTGRTKAIVPVHLYGQPANMGAIRALADERGLHVVEDAAQAHGASYRGHRCGGIGAAAGFSFYPGKNLGAYGDGGAITTNDDALAGELRMLRNWGSSKKYVHERLGFNSRLDTMQAAVLLAKLPHLEEENGHRRELAGVYRELLAGRADLSMIETAEWTSAHAYHLFVVRVARGNRQYVVDQLHARGIGVGIHYPIPIHRQQAYAQLAWKAGSFPVSERLSDEVLSLPLCGSITRQEVETVAQELASALDKAALVGHARA